MIVIKRWILIALAALIVIAVVLSITLTSCDGRKKGEDSSSSDNISSYTESEIEEIKDWWSSVQIEEAGDTAIETN